MDVNAKEHCKCCIISAWFVYIYIYICDTWRYHQIQANVLMFTNATNANYACTEHTIKCVHYIKSAHTIRLSVSENTNIQTHIHDRSQLSLKKTVEFHSTKAHLLRITTSDLHTCGPARPSIESILAKLAVSIELRDLGQLGRIVRACYPSPSGFQIS